MDAVCLPHYNELNSVYLPVNVYACVNLCMLQGETQEKKVLKQGFLLKKVSIHLKVIY